ncbi:MAG: pantoate--beta-alanine ligase [Deltaproteobacteria bacterium]|nr:pantoate--beta-alanine ligase [Deltaproteobacteria bacterium]
MVLVEKIREMQTRSTAQRRAGQRIVLVPTMGSLHEGHLSLVREGRKRGDYLVVSIFVNPAQFGPGEDYRTYPRNLERDRELLEAERVDVLFCPSAEEMYPAGFQSYVEPGKLSSTLCGRSRPGHFRGVATVVAKLFNQVRPHVAIFGAKDYQQLLILRRMVEDLNFDVEIVQHPIVREKDGLALSSRNNYLSPAEKQAAFSLSRALRTAECLVGKGVTERERIIGVVEGEIAKEPLARVDYISLCHSSTLEELNGVGSEALLALAVWIGKTRLIDNTVLRP